MATCTRTEEELSSCGSQPVSIAARSFQPILSPFPASIGAASSSQESPGEDDHKELSSCGSQPVSTAARSFQPILSPFPASIGAASSSQESPGEDDHKEVPRVPTIARLEQEEDDEELEMPKAFGCYMLLSALMFPANYTVILPTSSSYVASLGGGGWFAGTVVASSIGAGLLTIPFVQKYLLPRAYKPALLILAAFCCIGNVLYGLGQLFESLWVLLIGRVIQGLWSGGCGPALAQHAVYACVGKRKRTEWTATIGNFQFLGMGLGPLLAAALAKLSFSIGLLQVDEYTNPGWAFAIFWLLAGIALIFIEEPSRPFEKKLEKKSVRVGESNERVLPNMKIVWCLFGMGVCSAAMAAWETGAAVITQKYFGYGIMLSSIVIGVGFLTCTLGGHLVKFLIARYHLIEADVAVAGMAMILLCSAMLYWYLPTEVALERRIGNEISYMIGSVLVLNAANFTRNYCVALTLREAAAVSSQMKDTAVSAQAGAMMFSRAVGALCGMGVASLPGGANYAAASVTAISAFMLIFVSAPGLFSGLRRI